MTDHVGTDVSAGDDPLERRALALAEQAHPGLVETAGFYPFGMIDGPVWRATLTDGRRVEGPFEAEASAETGEVSPSHHQ